MGYTHYWDKAENITDEAWALFLTFVKKAMTDQQKAGVEIVGGLGEVGTSPELTDRVVCFNGCGDESHEGFLIDRDDDKWSFCKTARKEYDTLVFACLLAGKKYGVLSGWGSDGSGDDHTEGKKLYRKISRAVKLENLDNDVDELSKIEQKLIARKSPIMDGEDAFFIEGVKETIEALRKYNIKFY